MGALFSTEGFARLDAIVRPGLLCAFDFDGTLSPIVALPEHACLPTELMYRLVELSAYAPVAIITGRALDDVRERLGFVPDFVVGNHGIEGLPGWEEPAARHRAVCRLWHERLSSILHEPAMFDPGIVIENKRYSLSVHYRHARDPIEAESRLRNVLMHLEPLPRVISGKCVFNLLPEEAGDKGSALEQLMQISRAQSAIYIGDDITDEDVFRLRRGNLLTVRIECTTETEAEFFLRRRQDMAQLLDELINRLHTLGARNWTLPAPISH
ncbi:trehalose-phosphatase [Noviherbaspirillum cavernae]|uniref:Trehalose 6-phosphate phosphatase n=1 Tax=Noviherbaspirillum cavernae TaxID=2320862 RepID=A0A418X0U8_9BURK|nr:trehalose-phosphatase [Noviherbaspirillum cavernae]RJG06114.1 trehalose-phosphatase [Noviherbaspirillum cavernae]